MYPRKRSDLFRSLKHITALKSYGCFFQDLLARKFADYFFSSDRMKNMSCKRVFYYLANVTTPRLNTLKNVLEVNIFYGNSPGLLLHTCYLLPSLFLTQFERGLINELGHSSSQPASQSGGLSKSYTRYIPAWSANKQVLLLNLPWAVYILLLFYPS